MSFFTAYIPRRLRIGPLVLDILHRDARCEDRWLSLHPREFELLWRLGEAGGKPVARRTLLRDVWRLTHEPETNSVEVHVYRLRAKLAAHGISDLVLTHDTGGYSVDVRCGELGPVPNAGLDTGVLLRETAGKEKEDRYDIPDQRACFD